MNFNNVRLREILSEIDSDQDMLNRYKSCWLRLVNFIYHNSGLTIAKLAEGGSMAKSTSWKGSDLDVIFCLSPDEGRNAIYPYLIKKLIKVFQKSVSISRGFQAIHINFNRTDCDIDLILLDQLEFDRNYEGIKNISQISQTKLNAIKLVKYAVDQALLSGFVPGYIIERTGLNIKENNLDLNRTVQTIISILKNPRFSISFKNMTKISNKLL